MITKTVFNRGAWLVLGVPLAIACGSAEKDSGPIAETQQALGGAALPAPLRVFGQPDMKQTNLNEVVPNRVNYPSGILINRETSASLNSHVYVFDGSNNRILGFDSIGACTGGSKAGQACTEDSFCTGGTCTINTTKNASFALGQPTTSGTSACNGDNTSEAAPSASSLCTLPFPHLISPYEGPHAGQMSRDTARNLYVVDPYNNRVLRYNNPFAAGGDTVADWQFGQANMTSRQCNRGNINAPTAQTLCTGDSSGNDYPLYFASAVSASNDGQQVWVADPGNHRVLKVSPSSANAQLVLGQANFTSRSDVGCWTTPTMNSICSPTGVAFDSATNKLYVLESQVLGNDGAGTGRVMVFNNPTTNNQAAAQIWNPPAASPLFWPRGLTLEPNTGAVWVSDTGNLRLERFLNGTVTHVIGDNDLVRDGDYCTGDDFSLCAPQGSIGIDRDTKFYIGDLDTERVKKFPAAAPIGGAYVNASGIMFDQPGKNNAAYANRVGPGGLAQPGYVVFAGSQMVVADRWRIVFWNNYTSTATFSGGNASGFLAQDDFNSQATNGINVGGNFTSLSYDATKKLLYATSNNMVSVWSVGPSGLVSGQAPSQQFSSYDLTTPTGAGIPCFNNTCQFTYLTVDAANDIGWVTDASSNRVLRITALSTANRHVDLVLGQNNLTDHICNRGNGNGNEPGTITPNGFCDPAGVALDPQGNLFVVDGTWECREGNCRVVEYQKSDIPAPNGTLQAPLANPVKVFGPSDFTSRDCDPSSGRLCSPRFIAFDPRDGSMVSSGEAYHNPLLGRLAVWTNPVKSGVTAPLPTRVYSNFPINQAGAIAIDANGYMAVLDHTWNRVTLFQTAACNPATEDCVSAGSGGSNPCAGLCTNPVTFSSPGYNSQNLGTSATCHETTAPIVNGNCGNMGSRSFTINGATMTCNNQNFASLPAKRNGGYCFQASAGTPNYAYFATF